MHDEDALLARCYGRSLRLAVDHGAATIAFPSISTGVYRFPIERAARIAQREVKAFLEFDTVLRQVVLCCFSGRDLAVYEQVAAQELAGEDRSSHRGARQV